jgi:predicted branched-subunit amino acid permease
MPEHSVGRLEAGAAPSLPRPAVAVVAAASAGAAAIHAAVIPEHLEEWWAFGLFFLLTGVVQLVWAVMVVRSSSRSVIWLGVLGNASIVFLWIITRTVGTLIGPEPHTPETVGLADALATAFELVIVVTGAWLITEGRSTPGRD